MRQECILSLPDLITLNLTRWPGFSFGPDPTVQNDFSLRPGFAGLGGRGESERPITFEVYKHLLQRIVQAIFTEKDRLVAEARISNLDKHLDNSGGGGGGGGGDDDATITSTSGGGSGGNDSNIKKRVGVESKLRVISFGTNSKCSHIENVTGPNITRLNFLRGTQIDPNGISSPTTMSVDSRALQFIEPDSDILDCRFPDIHPHR